MMSMVPFVVAERPAPMGTSISPSFTIDDSDESETDDSSDDSDEAGDTTSSVGGGGSSNPRLMPSSEAQEEDSGTREAGKVVRTSLLSQYVASITPTFRIWKVRKIVADYPNADTLIKNFSDNITKVFLHLPRAEQKRILEMTQGQAEEQLGKYQLLAVNKSLLYQVRVIPVPVLINARERVQDAKEEYEQIKQELDDEKVKFERAKLGRNEEQATEHAQKFMIKTADLVIKALERVKHSVETSDDISEEEAEEILAEIQEEIDAMEEAKSDVEAAETKAQVQDAGKVILNVWKHTRIRIKRHVTRLIHARLGEIIKRSEHLESKLDCTLQSLEEQGLNISAYDAMVDDFSLEVDNAKSKFRQARNYLDQAKELKSDDTSDEDLAEVEGLVQAAQNLIDQAKDHTKQAHEILKELVRAIKDAGGELTDCQEPELEEDQVYDVVEEED